MVSICVATLAALLISRVVELAIAARHERLLRARGAREAGRSHFPLFVALHAAFPVALWWEVAHGDVHPPSWWPVCAVIVLAAQGLRAWSMHALGDHWTARVWVIPGVVVPPRGPYRVIAHPSYLAVTLELAALPLAFGAWRTACGATLINALALAIRIPVEQRALRSVALAGRDTPQ